MTTPVDLTGYIDLTLYDADAQALIDDAKADLATKLPDLVLREGTIEAVLIEALGLAGAELIYAINRLPAATFEGLLLLYGIARDAGAPPDVTLRVTVADTAGYVFPAGLRARLAVAGGDPLTFTTTTEITIAPGATTGTSPAVADRNTADVNGTAAGAILELLDAYPSVQTIDTTTTVANGRAEETSAAWRDRGILRLARLSDVLSVPRHFVAAALETAGVTRAMAVDNWNSATGLAANGFITVAVYGAGGTISAGGKTAIQVALDDRAQANLSVSVVDPTITSVAVTVDVIRKAGYTDAQVKANITTALDAYLNPQTWGAELALGSAWPATVYRNELISIIDQAEGVSRVVSLAAPAADVALTGIAPLPSRGVLTMTTA